MLEFLLSSTLGKFFSIKFFSDVETDEDNDANRLTIVNLKTNSILHVLRSKALQNWICQLAQLYCGE